MPLVIDLLSSSPRPQAANSKPRSGVDKPAAKPLITSTSIAEKSTLSMRPPPGNEWQFLSDDDDDDDALLTALPSKSSSATRAKPKKSPISNFLPPLSSDDDPYTLPSLKTSIPNAAKPAKRDHDIFFLSDDFDSTVNLDSSLNDAREPPAKKARPSVSNSSVALNKVEGNQGSGLAEMSNMRSAAYNRSYLNIESSTRNANVPKSKHSTSTGSKALDLDPLIFTSSPDPHMDAIRKRKEKEKANSSTKLGILPELSSDTELSDLMDLPMSRPRKKQTAYEKYEADRETKKKAALKKAGKVQKAAKDNDEKARKSAVKEADQEKKRLAKEDKLREKGLKAEEKERAAALAKVNTLRTDKKVSAPEMIVDLPSALESKLKTQTEVFLEKFQVEHTTWESENPVVKFRRKVVAEFNEEQGQYEPVRPYIKEEKHIIYVLGAQDFVDLVTSKDEENDIDFVILQLKSQFWGCKIVVLIQGFNIWMRKNKNIQNRKYTQAVRAAGPHEAEAAPPTASQRKKKKEAEHIDENIIEDALLRLQMVHELFVHHTSVVQETAEQLAIFTQNISLIPYKTQKQPNGTAFCMESGQVKTGDGPADTYVKMLQEMVRITHGVAYGITAKYPTVRELIEGLQENGPLDLENCMKSANKNGAFTEQRIGPAISKRVHKVFLGRDPNSLNV